MEIELLKKENTPENVIEHCKAVCKKAMKIAANFDYAKRYGYCEDVLNIIERHIGAGITEQEAEKLGLPKKSYVPQTLEEKIVAHADNLISGSDEVDLDFVIKKWKRNIEDSDDNIERLIKLDNELIKAFEE